MRYPLWRDFNFFFSVNDNDELLSRARMLLVRMCGVTPPRPLIGPILNAIFDTIQNSPVRRSPADLLKVVLILFVVMEGPSTSFASGSRFVLLSFQYKRKPTFR